MNERFRKDIVPYMKDIVYYPCTGDVFDDVGEAAGISYYILGKDVTDSVGLRVSCKFQPRLNTEYFELKNKSNLILVNNKIESIINKCATDKYICNILNMHSSYYVSSTDSGGPKKSDNDIEVWGGLAGGEKSINNKKFDLLGYRSPHELKRLDNLDKYKVCLSIMPGGTSKWGMYNADGTSLGLMPSYIIGKNQVPKGSYFCLMWFNTLDGAKSLQSYLNCKLVRFLVRVNTAGTTLTPEFFRCVPDPGAFDHIFTDEELYAKYGLTQDEISLIESVIKERK